MALVVESRDVTTAADAATNMLLEVQDLRVSFRTDEGRVVAVDGVDFTVQRGRTLGIVGESGSGKSVSVKALIKLLPHNAIIGEGSRMRYRTAAGEMVDLAALHPHGRAMRRMRGGEIAMIFQEPMASFSPVYTIGNQIMEAVRLHRGVGKGEARALAIDMLDRVGIANPELRVDQYPHELSGGMRQRAMIAVALATNPSLLIADEPTTALDVTIQAQILALMRELQADLDMSIVFITHDMGVIAHVADEVAVMYLGRIVERGPTAQVIHDPKHPYTQGLLAALPSMDVLSRRLTPIGGDIPSPLEHPAGCPFQTRCPKAMPGVCEVRPPAPRAVAEHQIVSCFLYD
jgi:peptide/nickel transport system ATP-binding protein